MLRRYRVWLHCQRTEMGLAECCWKSLLTTGKQELFVYEVPHACVLQFFCNCSGKSAASAKKLGLGGELGVTTLAGWGCRWPQTVALGEVGMALFLGGGQHRSESWSTVWVLPVEGQCGSIHSYSELVGGASTEQNHFSPAKGHLEVICEHWRKTSAPCMTSVPKALVLKTTQTASNRVRAECVRNPGKQFNPWKAKHLISNPVRQHGLPLPSWRHPSVPPPHCLFAQRGLCFIFVYMLKCPWKQNPLRGGGLEINLCLGLQCAMVMVAGTLGWSLMQLSHGQHWCSVQRPSLTQHKIDVCDSKKRAVLPRFQCRPSTKKTKQTLGIFCNLNGQNSCARGQNHALWISAYHSWSWHSRAEQPMLQKAK